jgi:hypothetical protein
MSDTHDPAAAAEATRVMLTNAKAAFVRVGDGRGFAVEVPEISKGDGIVEPADRFIVTAAHCLPHLPPAHALSYTEERTYHALLGPLGAEPTVSAMCLFVDPVADLAVLCGPDDQVNFRESADHVALMETLYPLPVGAATKGEAWLLTLDQRWEACQVSVDQYGARRSSLTILGAKEGVAPGTSGPPIIGRDGRAIGVVTVAGGNHDENFGQPLLTSLPAWLLTALTTG